jgi:hypothetical protein
MKFDIGLVGCILYRACPGYVPYFLTWFSDGESLLWYRPPDSRSWESQGVCRTTEFWSIR